MLDQPEKVVRDKHSNSFCRALADDDNKFYNNDTRRQFYKTFSSTLMFWPNKLERLPLVNIFSVVYFCE